MHGRVSTVAVIVVNWNTRELLAQCLESIRETSGDVDVETVVVDNASSDGSAEMVGSRFPAVRVIKNPDNLGFARGNNQAIAATTAPYVLMLNSDARLTPGALQCLLERATSTPRAGLVGARIDNPDGSFQVSHMRFPNLAREALIVSGLGRLLYGASYPSFPPQPNGSARVVEWVSGACMLARRSALAQVGGFDEGYFLYGEEMDLCYALRAAGWQVWFEPGARITHRASASSAHQRELFEARLYRGRMRFFRKHRGPLAARLFAAELYAVTPAKMLVHGLMRRLSGGRIGRQVLSFAALRDALTTAGERPAPPSAPLLLLATGSRPGQRSGAPRCGPRIDYVELQKRTGADLLDYDVYPAGRTRDIVAWLETQLRSDPYLAAHGLRGARRYQRVACLSERVGIPFAAMCRAGAYKGELTVVFHAWSSRQEAAVTRLGLFEAIAQIAVFASALREHFIALGAPAERVHMLPWGTDHHFYTPAPRRPGPPFALTLGETRLRDYGLLRRAMDGLPLELRVRAGGYADAREKGSERRALPDNVILLPRLPATELRDLYAQSAFVVLPVRDELYPAGITASLEAMCMARAVVATRSRGLADYLVDGETCLLVEPGDAASLRGAICRLADDPELARRLGENGRRRVEQEFNQDHFVARLAALLQSSEPRP